MNDLKPVEITPKQLTALMKAIGIPNKIQLAKVCMNSPSGVGWYFTKNEIPLARLKLLALKFQEEVIEKNMDYSSDQVQMREFLEAKCGLDWKTIISDAKQVQLSLWKKMDKTRHTHGATFQTDARALTDLSAATLEQLTDEIVSRGWIVNLARKDDAK